MTHSVTFTETQEKPIGTIRTIKVQNVPKSTRRMIQTKAVTYYFSHQKCWCFGHSEARLSALLRACLRGGRGPQIGEVTCGRSPHLSCKRDQIKKRDYTDRQVTPPKRVTSPTWGPPPPCKQALNMISGVKKSNKVFLVRKYLWKWKWAVFCK